jgi:hypothetical protein
LILACELAGSHLDFACQSRLPFSRARAIDEVPPHEVLKQNPKAFIYCKGQKWLRLNVIKCAMLAILITFVAAYVDIASY